MRRVSPFLFGLLFLGACGAGDISKESSRPPRGNPDGLVTILEYSDLQCPACRSAHFGVSMPILEKYGTVVRYEFKHFPLRSLHRFAMDVAESSECAADQGKFWEFVDLAFEDQANLSYDALLDWAESLGLDVPLFERCWKSHKKRDTVLSDYDEGRALGVSGTPSFFVNGEKVPVGFDTLSAAIDKIVGVYGQRL